jgi:hypothetical protein
MEKTNSISDFRKTHGDIAHWGYLRYALEYEVISIFIDQF